MHWAAVAARRDFAFRVFGPLQRKLGGWRDECVDLRVESADACKQRCGELDRRELAALDQARGLGNRKKVQFGCHEFNNVTCETHSPARRSRRACGACAGPWPARRERKRTTARAAQA